MYKILKKLLYYFNYKEKTLRQETKRFLNKRWNEFVRHENGEYWLRSIHYHKQLDTFIFLTFENEFIKFRTDDITIKNKLLKISDIK